MNGSEIVAQLFNIEEDAFKKIADRHNYIDAKLILDLVNGFVVAKDLNESAKSKEKGSVRIWDAISGNAKKRQNLINENMIEGLKAASKWLQDHDEHLSRVEFRIKDIAEELYRTQDEILKFYAQFKDVKLSVEMLEEFKKSAEKRFEDIEKRLKKIEAQQQIDREVSKIGELGLPVEIEIFTILDNLASGEFGLWILYEKDDRKKEEQLGYLKRKIKEKLKIEGKEYLDFKRLSSVVKELDIVEQQAIRFITEQYRAFSHGQEYEMIDLVALSATHTPEEIETVINQKSHIRTFLTYDNFVDSLTNETIVGETL